MADTKDYGELVKKLLISAKNGNAQSQYHLGVLYNDGKGVEKDYKQAASWYLKAAQQGHQKAQLYLGLLYQNGRGVERDYKQAAQWLQKSAEQGEQKAQYFLGVLYYKGAGVKKNFERAAHWLEQSANQGNSKAQELLDEILSISFPEPEDIEEPYNEEAEGFDNAKPAKNSDSILGTILCALLIIIIILSTIGGGYYYFFMRKPEEVKAKNVRAPVREEQNNLSRSEVPNENRNSETLPQPKPSMTPQELQNKLVSAVSKNDVNAVLDFLSNGADPNFVDGNKISLLQTVIMTEDETLSKNDKRRIVSAMIKNGADVNYHGESGISSTTPLSLAVQNDDSEIAKILLDNGADPDLKDDTGYTAVDYANMLMKNSKIRKSNFFPKPQKNNNTEDTQTKVVRAMREEEEDEGDEQEQVSKVKASKNYRTSETQTQLDKLIRDKKVPDYIRDSGRFSFNKKYKGGFIDIRGTNVRLRSQPNTQARIIASGNEDMWLDGNTIEYLGEWTNPEGERWILGDYQAANTTRPQTVWIYGKYTELVTEKNFEERLQIEAGEY